MNKCDSSDEARVGLRRLRQQSVLVALAMLATLFLTSFNLPLTWDEGNGVIRSYPLVTWFEKLISGEPGVFSPETLAQHWQFTNTVEGHPTLFAIVISAGYWISDGWLPAPVSYRFGPMVLFAVAAGAVFYRMAREYSMTVAIGTMVAICGIPRLFAHVHFASHDSPLISCWMLAWASFGSARMHWRGVFSFGFVLGMALSCKFTGWMVPLPFLVWALLYRDRRAVRALGIGMPVAFVVFLALNPTLWHAPIEGMREFFRLNMNRGFNIPTQFFGEHYNLDHRLPWYNTIVWVCITVPVGLLGLLICGLWGIFRGTNSQRRSGVLLVGHWLILLVVRATPFAPPHDAVRLFVASFPFLAAIAGIGFGRLFKMPRSGGVGRRESLSVKSATALLLLGASVANLGLYAPQWLSFYSCSIGGLRGATELGMEPTYFWDGLDGSVLDWLRQKTSPNAQVCFQEYPMENLRLMEAAGMLEFGYSIDVEQPFEWYVIQHRPSKWNPVDRWLVENETPAYSKIISQKGWWAWKLDVPLIFVFSHRQFEAARLATR